MFDFDPQYLVRLHPQRETYQISQGRTIFDVDADGLVPCDSHHGLYVSRTRLLSIYKYLIDGKPPVTNVIGNVKQHSWLGYFITLPPKANSGQDQESRKIEQVSQATLELKVARYAADGVHEDLDLTNFSLQPTSFRFEIELDADFADQQELDGERKQKGEVRREWRQNTDGRWELNFDYHAEHAYSHQGNQGLAQLHRGLTFRVHNSDSPPVFENGKIGFDVRLAPGGTWHACVDMAPLIDGKQMEPQYGCRSFFGEVSRYDRLRESFLRTGAKVREPSTGTLAPLVASLLERSKQDLAALRLYDLDQRDDAWVMAAGLPSYVALFGRDTLTAAWEAALLGPEMMRGTLSQLAKWQGTEENDWRDEQPGRMLHEAQDSPLAMLQFSPHSRYYGSITTSAFYPVIVSELWHWTGNKDLIYPLLDPTLRALRWLDKYARLLGDGFYYYKTRSEQGGKNQAWKDSGDGIVYDDGSQVEAPIATCEEQGFVYASKLQFSEVLWSLDMKDEARRLYRESQELKKRFNEAFFMKGEGSFALGLDSERQQIRSITSNPGHCIAAGIADNALVAQTADRLFSEDMFSGWGFRTLSSRNPAYDPYNYHRGSVWPVEHGAFAMGFFRYGLWEHLHRMAKALFEAAAIFDFYRLPEVFSGHSRDEDHPFPALYPKTNWPQAWSASAMWAIIQAMLGIYPYAPLNTLVVDPHLPEWLPDLTLEDLRVGSAKVSIRFYRDKDGSSDYRVLNKRGPLHILRQPSPWSLTAGVGERIEDVLTSFMPRKGAA